MNLDRKLVLLGRVLGQPKIDRSERSELVFDCPKCKHHKPKLSVNIADDNFHCWVCGFSGRSLVAIFSLGDISLDEISEYKNSLEIFSRKTEKKTHAVVCLPKEYRSLTVDHRSHDQDRALRFLKNRSITDKQIAIYKIGFCSEGMYHDRVIIPSFDSNGFLNFFTTRSIIDGTIKYKNFEGDKDIIFNDLLVDWTKPIILTEGPFDAIKAGTNAIPLQGTFLLKNSLLLKKIVTSSVPVYVALDSDARTRQVQLIKLLLRYGVEVFDCDLRKTKFKDLGEMEERSIFETMEKSKPVSESLQLSVQEILL